jgi:hypothetical protein
MNPPFVKVQSELCGNAIKHRIERLDGGCLDQRAVGPFWF